MDKALHGEKRVFYSLKDGELLAWRTHDVGILLDAANDAPEYKWIEKGGFQVPMRNGVAVARIPDEDAFCTLVRDWMGELIDGGVTDDLLDELNGNMANIRFVYILTRSRDGAPQWQRDIADMSRPMRVEEAAAYAFSNQLAIGGLDGLKGCQLDECKKFFVGRPNAKWCSTTCGSRHRVRSKRRRDRG